MQPDRREPGGRWCLARAWLWDWLCARLRSGAVIVSFLAMFFCSFTAFAQVQQKALTTAAQVWGLPAAAAAASIPVHMVATVDYYQADRQILFVSDQTGSVFVTTRVGSGPVRHGDLIDITGVTKPSYNSVVSDAVIRIIGKGRLPIARPAEFQSLMRGDLDCQYVSIRGTIRSASLRHENEPNLAEFELAMPGGVVRGYILDSRGLDLAGLIDAEVEISGVAGGIFNGREQLTRVVLYSSLASELKVLRSPAAKSEALPWTTIDKVIATRFIEDRSARVKVRGAVTFYEPAQAVVIQHDGESLLALTDDSQPIVLGSVVDVVGYASGIGYGPALEEAIILPTGGFEAIAPKAVSYAEAMAGHQGDGLVTLRGTVLSELHDAMSDSMVVTVDDHPVNLLLWTRGRQRLPDLMPGTTVTVTGICRILKTDSWNNAIAFRLDLRETDDVRVLALPSWWTVTHLLLLLATVLSVSIASTFWALGLRRRVAAQRGRIERSIRMERERSRLLEQINSEMLLDTLLEDICASMESLVGGVHCNCVLFEQTPKLVEPKLTERRLSSAASPPAMQELLFDIALTGTEGEHIGRFEVRGAMGRDISIEDRDILVGAASLCDLAVRQRRLYERLNYHSTHDQLTDVANRRLSDLHLEGAIRKAAKFGHRVGVVYIDVDRFKQINDAFGHKIGDGYLQEIALRLGSRVRADDLLSRIGGDEFLVTATGLNGAEDAHSYKQRLEACFHERFEIEDVTFRGSASIGVAIYPDHGKTAVELQRYADVEMYVAKQSCREQEMEAEALTERAAS